VPSALSVRSLGSRQLSALSSSSSSQHGEKVAAGGQPQTARMNAASTCASSTCRANTPHPLTLPSDVGEYTGWICQRGALHS